MIGVVSSSISGLGTTQTAKTNTTIAPAMLATPMARSSNARVRRATAAPRLRRLRPHPRQRRAEDPPGAAQRLSADLHGGAILHQ